MTTLCGGFATATYGTALGAGASWKIYDFGLTRANVDAAEANADAAVAGLAVSGLDVRRDVEIAYLEALARKRLTVVAEATLKSEDGHLDQAKRFVAAQAKDPIEVAQAQSRDSTAKSTLAQARSNEAVALANLRAAIGWIDPSRAPAVDPNWPTPSDEQPPELSQLVESAGNWSPQPTWSASLTLSWALWDGGRSWADQRIASANVTSAIASRDALLVSLTSALESSRAQIVANRASVDASTEAVTAAQAQLKLAEARYTQGLGSQIELADAQTAVTTANGNLITAEWQLADAWATLRRALGQQVQAQKP
jgi:outer membrane protein TolC